VEGATRWVKRSSLGEVWLVRARSDELKGRLQLRMVFDADIEQI
jgi:hypothetical protein